jgi:hypothetical protein
MKPQEAATRICERFGLPIQAHGERDPYA